ncbi:MAG: hypothetical protein SOH48_03725 [Eubacteriales bacterium]|jgi:hypothetical protein
MTLGQKKKPVRESFGRDYFGPIFARGQEQGDFHDGDLAVFGDSCWKTLLGCMALLSMDRERKIYRPDMDEMLAVYRK